MSRARDPIRTFGWFCVVAGVGIALVAVSYAGYETTRRHEDWLQTELSSGNVSRLRAALRETPDHPAWNVMSPWPGVIAGGGVTVGGIVLLAIRKADRRREDVLEDPR